MRIGMRFGPFWISTAVRRHPIGCGGWLLILAISIPAALIWQAVSPPPKLAPIPTAATLECRDIGDAYRQWLDATTDTDTGHDLAATRTFADVVNAYPDSQAAALGARLSVLQGDLTDALTQPGDQAAAASAATDAQSMRAVADAYTSCP